jgi:hypothetical protein
MQPVVVVVVVVAAAEVYSVDASWTAHQVY